MAMTWSEEKFPDISHLLKRKTVGAYILTSLVGYRSKVNRKLNRFISQIVRLADKAVVEYSYTREDYIAEIEARKRGDGTFNFIGIMNNLENCIITTKRVLNIFERIIKFPALVPFPLEESTKLYIKNHINKKYVKNLRDIIEHADEIIAKEELEKNTILAFMVNESGDGVLLGEYQLKFTELANLLIAIHESVRKICEHKF